MKTNIPIIIVKQGETLQIINILPYMYLCVWLYLVIKGKLKDNLITLLSGDKACATYMHIYDHVYSLFEILL